MQINIGVIGTGYWGSKHIEEYNNIKISDANIKIVTCDNNPNLNTVNYNNYNKMIENEDLNAVSICAPNEFHYQITRDCLNAGISVLVEKPLAMTIEQGIELIDIAKDNGLILSVGHIFRFNNAINKIRFCV